MPLIEREGVADMNITWDEIFQFCMLVVAVINLVLQVKNKEQQPPNFPKSGYFSVIQWGTDLLAAPFVSILYLKIDLLSTAPGFGGAVFYKNDGSWPGLSAMTL